MPPGGKAGLKPQERQAFLKSVAAAMNAHEQRRVTAQGRAVLRRLNRYEYENTVRDLLAAPWLQLRDSLPEDGVVQRFNKVGRGLDVSHVQMARYMETAEQAILAVLRASKEPFRTQRYYARDQKRLLGRMRYSSFNRHPERASIPILGFEAQPDVLAERVPITVGASDPKTRELEGFATPASTYIGNEYHFDQFSAPVGGRYRLRFNAFSIWIHTFQSPGLRSDKVSWWRPNREKTSKGRTTEPVTIYALSRGGEKRLLDSFDVGPEPAIHEIDVHLLPGEMILLDAARLFRSRPGFVGRPDATAQGMPGVAYRWTEVAGPVPNPAAGAKLSVTGENARDAKRLLRQFMARAYRRPTMESEVQRYLKIISDRLDAGFSEAVIAGYTAVLCSPGFLYLEEEPGPLSGYALATRLSYFLWNAPPDGELRRLAASGTLRELRMLRAQTERLLNAERSRDFTDAFLDYWLDLRKLGDTTPDVTLYPDYYLDDLLTESALRETQLFFLQLLRKNLPAKNVIDSDFATVNSHLARHYELPPVQGVAMREVSLPPDSVRGGSPDSGERAEGHSQWNHDFTGAARGVDHGTNFRRPAAPPPPGVPAVEPDTRGATTIRQQLAQHSSISSCAVCHAKIDAPGFALESFDVLGGYRERYRSTEEGERVKGLGKNGHEFTFRLSQPVDASGELAGGEMFSNVKELKRLLLKDERQIARNMVTQFVAYATGAPVTFGDRAEVERILDSAKRDGYGMRTLIHEIVQSKLFRNK